MKNTMLRINNPEPYHFLKAPRTGWGLIGIKWIWADISFTIMLGL